MDKTIDAADRRAADFLRRNGYIVLELGYRPIHDRRKEIPIVAYDRDADALVFVAVFQHDRPTRMQRFLPMRRRFVTQMRRTGRGYARETQWTGAVRCDTMDVYGDVEAIDHTKGVAVA